MNIQPVVVVSPWVALLITFWKPVLIGTVVLIVLLYATLLSAAHMARAARDAAPAAPTVVMSQGWRDALTAAAPTPKLRP